MVCLLNCQFTTLTIVKMKHEKKSDHTKEKCTYAQIDFARYMYLFLCNSSKQKCGAF